MWEFHFNLFLQTLTKLNELYLWKSLISLHFGQNLDLIDDMGITISPSFDHTKIWGFAINGDEYLREKRLAVGYYPLRNERIMEHLFLYLFSII
jgi:hypothetical protein